MSYLIREGPVKVHRVRNKQVVQALRRLELFRSVVIRRTKDSVRRPCVDGVGTIFLQLLDALLERLTSIDNVVNLTIERKQEIFLFSSSEENQSIERKDTQKANGTQKAALEESYSQ